MPSVYQIKEINGKIIDSITPNYDFHVLLRYRKSFFSEYGKITFVALSKVTHDFIFFQTDKLNENLSMFDNPGVSKKYNVRDIMGYEIIRNNTMIQKKASNFGKMMAGGLLFGGLGAIAGAIDTGSDVKTKIKEEYKVRLLLNDITQASIDLYCDAQEQAYRLLQTFYLLEEDYYKLQNKQLESIEELKIKDDNIVITEEVELQSYSNEIIKLADLRDKGILTDEEFSILKAKIISK